MPVTIRGGRHNISVQRTRVRQSLKGEANMNCCCKNNLFDGDLWIWIVIIVAVVLILGLN